MLSTQAIQDFKQLYLKKFNITLSDNEAETLFLQFLNFFKLIYKPIPKGEA
jgi:hypothetical protein